MRVLIVTVQVPFVRGGAEAHAASLLAALRDAGADAEIVALPFKWYPPERLLEQILACRLFDLSEVQGHKIDRVIGLRFPAYYVPHDQKVLWILHQHRPAYDQWEAGDSDLLGYPNGRAVRDAIIAADKRLLPEARKLFANSRNVADRLMRYCGIHSEPLYHPPPGCAGLRNLGDESFFYFPSRLDRMKRHELVIRALGFCSADIRLVISGQSGESGIADSLQKLARDLDVDGRIKWLGEVPQERKVDLYSRCTGVIYPPRDEDYGYVTLEAMLSAKPVITCFDSGGVLEFVTDERNGLVVVPTPEALGRAMDRVWSGRPWAAQLGAAGRHIYGELGISWESVTRRLLDAA